MIQTFKNLSWSAVLGAAAIFAAHAQGQELAGAKEMVTLIGQQTSLPTTGVFSVPLNDWREVQALDIDVEAIGSDATLEVLVNGEVKASIYIPGHDPHYFVTVKEATRSVELRYVTGGRIVINRMVASLTPTHSQPFPGGSYSSKAAALTLKIIANCNDFASVASSSDYTAYISPVKIKAGRAYAKATASGDIDSQLQVLLQQLLTQMQSNATFIDSAMRNDASFQIAVDFLTLEDTLDEVMH
jgi:hypothetical protein